MLLYSCNSFQRLYQTRIYIHSDRCEPDPSKSDKLASPGMRCLERQTFSKEGHRDEKSGSMALAEVQMRRQFEER